MSSLNFLKGFISVTEYDVIHKQISFFGIKLRFRHGVNNKHFYENLPIQPNKIVFRCSSGAYSCNPKAIAEEILKQNLPYDLVFVVNKNILNYIHDYPKNIRLVMQGTRQAFKEYATAKIWVENERRIDDVMQGFFKRAGQTYIQTFHGSLGIKKTGEERSDVRKNSFAPAKLDSGDIDYLISNGTWTTDFFKRIFWNNGKILEVGHPRNDIFFHDNGFVKDKVYKHFNIPKDKKIVLYAPTLREDNDINCYSLDCENLRKALSEKFGSDWCVMVRLHPLIVDFKDDLSFDFTKIIDATDYSDIQDLLVACDCLITDYSSCVYDYILQEKPAFIFATDVDKYDNTRGFQYPLTETPFSISTNNDELSENIRSFNDQTYKNAVKTFIEGKGCIDNGDASKKVVELIKEIMSDSFMNIPTNSNIL